MLQALDECARQAAKKTAVIRANDRFVLILQQPPRFKLSVLPRIFSHPTKLLRREVRSVSMTLLFFARVVELVDTQVSEF